MPLNAFIISDIPDPNLPGIKFDYHKSPVSLSKNALSSIPCGCRESAFAEYLSMIDSLDEEGKGKYIWVTSLVDRIVTNMSDEKREELKNDLSNRINILAPLVNRGIEEICQVQELKKAKEYDQVIRTEIVPHRYNKDAKVLNTYYIVGPFINQGLGYLPIFNAIQALTKGLMYDVNVLLAPALSTNIENCTSWMEYWSEICGYGSYWDAMNTAFNLLTTEKIPNDASIIWDCNGILMYLDKLVRAGQLKHERFYYWDDEDDDYYDEEDY